MWVDNSFRFRMFNNVNDISARFTELLFGAANQSTIAIWRNNFRMFAFLYVCNSRYFELFFACYEIWNISVKFWTKIISSTQWLVIDFITEWH